MELKRTVIVGCLLTLWLNSCALKYYRIIHYDEVDGENHYFIKAKKPDYNFSLEDIKEIDFRKVDSYKSARATIHARPEDNKGSYIVFIEYYKYEGEMNSIILYGYNEKPNAMMQVRYAGCPCRYYCVLYINDEKYFLGYFEKESNEKIIEKALTKIEDENGRLLFLENKDFMEQGFFCEIW